MIQGTIIRVAGPVVDVQFTAGKLPGPAGSAYRDCRGHRAHDGSDTACQRDHCALHHAFRQREGLGRRMTVTATGHGLTAPVGEATLGRMFDPLGRPIDGTASG